MISSGSWRPSRKCASGELARSLGEGRGDEPGDARGPSPGRGRAARISHPPGPGDGAGAGAGPEPGAPAGPHAGFRARHPQLGERARAGRPPGDGGAGGQLLRGPARPKRGTPAPIPGNPSPDPNPGWGPRSHSEPRESHASGSSRARRGARLAPLCCCCCCLRAGRRPLPPVPRPPPGLAWTRPGADPSSWSPRSLNLALWAAPGESNEGPGGPGGPQARAPSPASPASPQQRGDGFRAHQPALGRVWHSPQQPWFGGHPLLFCSWNTESHPAQPALRAPGRARFLRPPLSPALRGLVGMNTMVALLLLLLFVVMFVSFRPLLGGSESEASPRPELTVRPPLGFRADLFGNSSQRPDFNFFGNYYFIFFPRLQRGPPSLRPWPSVCSPARLPFMEGGWRKGLLVGSWGCLRPWAATEQGPPSELAFLFRRGLSVHVLPLQPGGWMVGARLPQQAPAGQRIVRALGRGGCAKLRL